MEACYRSVDNYHVAKDAARDVIVRAVHDADIAIFNFNNARDEVAALLDEAVGQIEVESELDRTPPHHHFWLDDHIDVYRRHLRCARRLTYLALRSFEYESQQSIGLRGQVLSARHPDSLLQVVEAIEQRNAPMQGEQGFVIGETGIVLSLRDEILRILDLANTGDLEPGDPPISAEEAFRRYLRSGSARIYDRAGNYLGQGMRFVLRPDGWSQTSCAERTWRLTTSIQMVGTLNNPEMVLLQENAFASQKCRAQERGELRVARIRPNHNLLVGETSNFDEPSQYTAMNVDGYREARSSTATGTMAGGSRPPGRGERGSTSSAERWPSGMATTNTMWSSAIGRSLESSCPGRQPRVSGRRRSRQGRCSCSPRLSSAGPCRPPFATCRPAGSCLAAWRARCLRLPVRWGPRSGGTRNRHGARRRPRSCTWRMAAERGLFAFDSDPHGGPYRMVAAPELPVRTAELPAIAAEVVGLLRFPHLRFAALAVVSEELLRRR